MKKGLRVGVPSAVQYGTAIGILCCCFLNFMIYNDSRLPTLVNAFPWRKESKESLPGDDRFPGTYLPYLKLSAAEREEMQDGKILIEYFQGRSWVSKVVFLKHHDISVIYLNRPFSEPAFTSKGKDPTWKSYGPKLKAVGDYFRYLRTAQTDCRKLIRMGGGYDCSKKAGEPDDMDGHKYICMEPPLLLAHGSSRDPRKCLTLSFGVEYESSFDDAMADLPCEVHMYDIFRYQNLLAKEVKHVHIHYEGLAGAPRTNLYVAMLNYTAYLDRLRNHVAKRNLTTRLIHVLKVDIENSEWESFRDIAQDPIFDAVGQVALEVHTMELVNELHSSWVSQIPKERWLEAVQDRYDVLRAIEARGFQRVLYQENRQKGQSYYDTDGTAYTTSGELLYINTNWYNSSFMKKLALRGYDVHEVR